MRSPLKIPCATPAWGAWSLWTMSHPSHRRRAARCWPSASLRGGQQVVTSSLDSMWSIAIAGAQGTGACSRLSPPVPGPRGGRGHTCRTPPRACSVSNARSLSMKCQAGTLTAYPVQQRLRFVRGWLFWSIGGRRAATTP